MQDIEFTIQAGKLWMLQTRTGKRTVRAAVKIAVDMVHERLISREVAVARVDARQLDQLLHPTLDPEAPKKVIAKGLPASPGAACGTVVFSADEAEAKAKARREGHAGAHRDLARGHPRHVRGRGHPHRARRHDVARGGRRARHGQVLRRRLRHAADRLRARRAARRRQAGARRRRDHDRRLERRGDPRRGRDRDARADRRVRRADEVGRRHAPARGAHQRRHAARRQGRARLRRRGHRPLPHRAHVLRSGAHPRRARDDPRRPTRCSAAARSRSCCRCSAATSSGSSARWRACRSRSGCSIRRCTSSCRTRKTASVEVAEALGDDVAAVRARIEERSEFNPMLGHRGCRLGITFPEIYRMQVRAIMEAACEVAESGVKVRPEIMIPLVAHVNELARLRKLAEDEIAQVLAAHPGSKVKIPIGTMIEVPRAALIADEIAELRRVLLVRHQRPDADDVCAVARRRAEVPARLSGERDPGGRSVRLDRPRWHRSS